VVCIYSSFLQRAFDQIACDACLHRLPVTFVIDRAGITGDDGPSHHGMLDLAYLRCIPNLVVGAPSSPDEMRRMLATALAHDGPFAFRYPRGSAPATATAPLEPLTIGRSITRREGDDIAIIAVGKMVRVALEAAGQLEADGISSTVVDARFVKPVDPHLVEVAAAHRAVLTVEDGTRVGGFGSAVAELLGDTGVAVPVRRLGIPDRFVEHGAQALLLSELGLDADGVARSARELLATARRDTVLT
jgi:1-deoxy-D-xylulose-5-phosphate synthase